MLEYIFDNKEWIFSGIGITILGLLFLIFKYILKGSRAPEKNIESISNNIPKPETPNLPPIGDFPQEDVFGVIQELESLPPLQLDGVRSHYSGLKVDWITKYSYAYEIHDDLVRISLDLITKSSRPISVICEVKLSEYKRLSILKKKSKVRVIGEISEFDLYRIGLSNVKLFFQE